MAFVDEVPPESGQYVLIVGSHPAADALQNALESVAPVTRCPGAANGECPAVLLKPCPLRDNARAKVIFFAGEHEFFTPGRWDCMAGSPSPSVAVLEGMDFSDVVTRVLQLSVLSAVLSASWPPSAPYSRSIRPADTRTCLK